MRTFVEIDGRVHRLPALSLFELPFIELLLDTFLAEQHVVICINLHYLLEVSTTYELVLGVLEELLQLFER